MAPAIFRYKSVGYIGRVLCLDRRFEYHLYILALETFVLSIRAGVRPNIQGDTGLVLAANVWRCVRGDRKSTRLNSSH